MTDRFTFIITILFTACLGACSIDDTIKQISETTGDDGSWPLCCPILQDGSVDGCACRLSEDQICDPDNEVPATCPVGEEPVDFGDHWGCPGLAGGCGVGFEGDLPIAEPDGSSGAADGPWLAPEPQADPCMPGFCGSCPPSTSGTVWCTGVTGAVGPGSCPEGASYQSCGDGCFAGARGGDGGYCGIGTASGTGECCS